MFLSLSPVSRSGQTGQHKSFRANSKGQEELPNREQETEGFSPAAPVFLHRAKTGKPVGLENLERTWM